MSGGNAKVGKGNAGVGKFREMQCPEYGYRHWCTKVSPGVQITPGGLSRYREVCSGTGRSVRGFKSLKLDYF